MAQFIGRAIEVTLAQPPGILVQGTVANVIEQTSTLILENGMSYKRDLDLCRANSSPVYFPGDGRRLPTCSVDGSQIADIKLIHDAPPQQAQYHAPQPAFTPAPIQAAPQPAQTQHAFVDPAVLSMGKRPSIAPQQQPRLQNVPLEAPATPLKLAATAPPPTNMSPFIGEARQPSPITLPKKKRNGHAGISAAVPAMTAKNKLQAARADDTDEQELVESGVRRASITKTRTGKPMDAPTERQKKPKGARAKKQHQQALQDGYAPETSPEIARKQQPNENYRGKGWRQTPILEDADVSPSRTPGVIDGRVGQQAILAERKKTKKQRALEKEERQNGWATEDATDIQDLPEFDFVSNLNKFDKRSVFDQIRNEDTTADDERLVSFNRLPARPGTHGGKNLHPTENVLDGSNKGGRRSSQDSSSNEEFDFGSGRNSRRAMSRASTKRAPLRSNSNLAEDSPAPGAASSSHSAMPARPRARGGLGMPQASYSSRNHGSPNPNTGRFTPPTSPTLDRVGSFSATAGEFRLLPSNRKCPYITPGGMGAVEETAEVEFGISSAIISENAGRGIAEVVLNALNSGGRRMARENVALNGRPACLLLVGTHKAGARAAIAARHLIGKGVKVVVCVLGYERMATSSTLDRDLRQQLDTLQKLGGSVRGWQDISSWLQRPGTPAIEAVVDALLFAGGKVFDGLAPEDQRDAVEMIAWANASSGRLVISIDAPSGMNGSTGKVSSPSPAELTPCAIAVHRTSASLT